MNFYVNLKVIQQRTAQAHFSQRHVWMTAVKKALDLRADVQSQRLGSLDFLWRKDRPRAAVLL